MLICNKILMVLGPPPPQTTETRAMHDGPGVRDVSLIREPPRSLQLACATGRNVGAAGRPPKRPRRARAAASAANPSSTARSSAAPAPLIARFLPAARSAACRRSLSRWPRSQRRVEKASWGSSRRISSAQRWSQRSGRMPTADEASEGAFIRVSALGIQNRRGQTHAPARSMAACLCAGTAARRAGNCGIWARVSRKANADHGSSSANGASTVPPFRGSSCEAGPVITVVRLARGGWLAGATELARSAKTRRRQDQGKAETRPRLAGPRRGEWCDGKRAAGQAQPAGLWPARHGAGAAQG